MTYATQADIESRYPGELAQAGPKTPDGLLDEAAVGLALAAAEDAINRALRVIGWTVPLADPAPGWTVALAVDLALYRATPTVLASQEDFKDRRARHDAALATLEAIAAGRVLPPLPAGVAGSGVLFSSSPRQFGRGCW